MRDFFISYTGNDLEWAKWIVITLEGVGYTTTVQYRDFAAGGNFAIDMHKAMLNTHRTIALLSADYLLSDFALAEWAEAFARDPDGSKQSLIPIRIGACELGGLLRARTHVDLVGLSKDDAKRKVFECLPHRATSEPPSGAVSISHLPNAGEFLVGRVTEIARLDAAWEHGGEHVITIVGRGGEGKSNLVAHWLLRMSHDGWRDAERVFGWSFYSQGTSDRAASSDQFIDSALRFFGEASPESIKSPHERGDRLASLVGAKRNLLILDGLEPLQYPPGTMCGRLKDPAIAALLSGLSAFNRGLCVITTREALPELAGGKTTVSPEIELPALTPEAGGALLFNLGVTTGNSPRREEVARHLGGHAFSIQLLGTALAEAYDGDIAQADKIALLEQEGESGDHARHILESYERWLSGKLLLDGEKNAMIERDGARMLAVLRLLGLFDRPADHELLDVLREAPAIEGLTEPIVGLALPDWKRTISRLEALKLVNDDAGTLDAHPLIREHFAAQLEREFGDAAREAHRRLFEHLRNSAPDLPDNLREMIPLFQAVVHGCKARLWKIALDDVYYRSIQRGDQGFAFYYLGAAGLSLTALSSFFGTSWNDVVGVLPIGDRSYVACIAGASLDSLGRTNEAASAYQLALTTWQSSGDWKNACIAASNLTDSKLIRGHVGKAVQVAEQACEYADRAGDEWQRSLVQADLGSALHAAGALELAKVAFNASKLPNPYNHCDLLLRDSKRVVEVRQLAQTSLAYDQGLVAKALSHLTIGRSWAFDIEHAPDGQVRQLAESHLSMAVNLMRESGALDRLPLALFHRAFCTLISDFDLAQKDLNEADQIASLGNMVRWQIEIAVVRTRLYIARKDDDKAREELERAKRLVKETEAPYEPHVPDWKEWKPPSYVNAFKKGQIVGYYRCNDEIAALEKSLPA